MNEHNQREDQRNEARNNLEETVYEIRDTISSDMDDNTNVNAKQLCEFLDYVEEWLYSFGENCQRETYLQLRKEIAEFNMMDKVKRIDDQTEDEINLFKAKIFSIMQL